jgi:hypothetical protein
MYKLCETKSFFVFFEKYIIGVLPIGKFYPSLLRFTNYIEIMQVKNSDNYL